MQGMLGGKTVDQAYAVAGFRPHRGNAWRMSTNESVLRRLAEQRAPAIKAAQITLEGHLHDLEALRNAAAEAGQYGAAITAEVNRGKASGLYVERRISSNETTVALRDEALSTINRWLAEQLAGEDGSTEVLGEERPLLPDPVSASKTRH